MMPSEWVSNESPCKFMSVMYLLINSAAKGVILRIDNFISLLHSISVFKHIIFSGIRPLNSIHSSTFSPICHIHSLMLTSLKKEIKQRNCIMGQRNLYTTLI